MTCSIDEHMEPLRRLIAECRHQARLHDQRRAVIFAGDREWSLTAGVLVTGFFDPVRLVWLGNDPPGGARTVAANAGDTLLGSDTDCIVINAHGGFDVDSLGAATGSICGGGLLVLLTPPFEAWPSAQDPVFAAALAFDSGVPGGQFVRRFARIALDSAGVVCVTEEPGQSAEVKEPGQSGKEVKEPGQSGKAAPEEPGQAGKRSGQSYEAKEPGQSGKKPRQSYERPKEWGRSYIGSRNGEEPGQSYVDSGPGKAARGRIPATWGQSLTGTRSVPTSPISRTRSMLPTTGQRHAVEAIVDLGSGELDQAVSPPPVVLVADRGRGKSAALGMAAARLMAGCSRHIIVTAPRFAAVRSVFQHATGCLDGARFRRGRLIWRDSLLEFMAPDALLATLPPADLLLIDEAAGIPLPMLERFLGKYRRVALASTVHGYEGTGRSFATRFWQSVRTRWPDWKPVVLATPVRWAEGDPVERFLFRALLLDAEPDLNLYDVEDSHSVAPAGAQPSQSGDGDRYGGQSKHMPRRATENARTSEVWTGTRDEVRGSVKILDSRHLTVKSGPNRSVSVGVVAGSPGVGHSGSLHIEEVNRESLGRDEVLLNEVFGLLVLAHYRTRPRDLRYLLDAPNLRVYAARLDSRTVGVSLVASEGGFSEELSKQVVGGLRRRRGHLIPQSLGFHGGVSGAPRLRCARVVRLAVHPSVQNRGVGTSLLEYVVSAAARGGYDYVAASFGATAELVRFWRRCGFVVLRVGFTRDHASGAHSVIVARPVSEAGACMVFEAGAKFQAVIPSLLSGTLQLNDALVEQLTSN